MRHITNKEVIYHYTSLSTALEYILFNGTLRLSPLIETNDPKETKEWIPTLDLSGKFQRFSMEEIKSEFNSIKNEAKIICFSEDRTPPQTSKYEIDVHLVPVRKNYYKGYYRPRMWAQYADNHKGLCLGFNKKSLINKIRKQFESSGMIVADSVSYSDHISEHYSAITLDLEKFQLCGKSFIKQHYERYMKTIFFEKSIDWKDESEYRVLYLPIDSDKQKVSYLIDIKDCIETIIVGNDFPEVYKPSLICLKKEKYPNVALEQLKYYNGKPLLTPF